MSKCFYVSTVIFIVIGFFFASAGGAQQFPLLDDVAAKVVQKYQTSTCQQLWQQKASKKPKPEMDKKLAEMLRQDPQMRTEFFNRVSVPIATKMFECGMIP